MIKSRERNASFPPFFFALSVFICNFAAETIINRDSYGSIEHFIRNTAVTNIQC